MKPIVLATDGSPSAAAATTEAVELAAALGAPLVAVAVEHVNVPGYGYYGYADLVNEYRKIENEHVTQTLQKVSAAAAEHAVHCETVHATGAVVDDVTSIARTRNARMIVIGAHGWGALGRALHGSVSRAVLQEAPCPVLVVRGGEAVEAEALAAEEAVPAR